MLSTPRSSLEPQKKPIKVAIAGFEPKTTSTFEQFIKELNGTYIDQFSLETNILISSSVLSEKYRV